jgi:hypothetical protein
MPCLSSNLLPVALPGCLLSFEAVAKRILPFLYLMSLCYILPSKESLKSYKIGPEVGPVIPAIGRQRLED